MQVAQGVTLGAVKQKRNQGGAQRSHPKAELSGKVITESGRADFRDRQATPGMDQGLGFEVTDVRRHPESAFSGHRLYLTIRRYADVAFEHSFSSKAMI